MDLWFFTLSDILSIAEMLHKNEKKVELGSNSVCVSVF